ncbi:class I SAM-dependent methyltransferase [Saccharopolyspora sp. NPDC002376]
MNEAAIRRWSASAGRQALEATAADRDFAKRHLINPVLLRLLGDVSGQRVLDAGCGNGYFSRMLSERGAHVVGVEPAEGFPSPGTRKPNWAKASPTCRRTWLGFPISVGPSTPWCAAWS